MSVSVRPHRRQPTRLPSPWDSPGKNTGGGCHFLLQCIKVKSESEVAQSCLTLSDPMDCSLPDSSIHGIFQARVLEWGAIAFSDQTHRHLKTHYWTIHCPPERRGPSPHTRTPMQASLTRKPWQATLVQPHRQGGTSTIKRNHKLPAYRKATPNTEM